MGGYAAALLNATQWLYIVYFTLLTIGYLALDAIALRVVTGEVLQRIARNLPHGVSGLEPPISVLVPAYNEEQTIAASIRSIMQLTYAEYEVLVINDGSRDNTLRVLIEEFSLMPLREATRAVLATERIRGVYVSSRHPNLRLIDKDNGGKADALNAGINASRYPLFCAVDADSVMQRESLQYVVRPFLEDPTVIATGGTIRLANGCTVSEGFIEAIATPSNMLARIQVVEYLRAFLFGRMGWSPLNAMLIVSGAFGLFNVRAVIEAGGYRRGTIGEDMELVVRLHKTYRQARKPYRIVFVPDPICWTEAPEDFRSLRNQRVRWQQGLMESLWSNRSLCFDRRGGWVGNFAFPFMFVFEGIGPSIELMGYVLSSIALALGWISASVFVAFLVLAIGCGLLLSASALLLEEISFHVYPKRSHIAQLSLAMLLENFGYRQLTSWWRLVGLVRWLRRRPGEWGEIKRTAGWQRPAGGA